MSNKNSPIIDFSEERKRELESKYKVLIGIPHNKDYIDTNFMKALMLLQSYIGGSWSFDTGTLHGFVNDKTQWAIYFAETWVAIERARNEIVDIAIQNDFTHVMLIDSDMIFRPDYIHQLLSFEKDVVSATIYNRHPSANGQFMSAVFQVIDGKTYASEEVPKQGLLEREDIMTGGAFLLVRTSVFDKIGIPYFTHLIKYIPIEENGKKSYKTEECGEDLYFGLKCLENKITICVDTDMVVGHQAVIPIPYKNFHI